MATLREIEDAVAETLGKALLDPTTARDPHEGDLPIRQHETGRIVAWIPRECADGAKPVVHEGLVVGYYREYADGSRSFPMFLGHRFMGWWESNPRELWMSVFDAEGGDGCGSVLLGYGD
jgi:hypothetical protein